MRRADFLSRLVSVVLILLVLLRSADCRPDRGEPAADCASLAAAAWLLFSRGCVPGAEAWLERVRLSWRGAVVLSPLS